MRSILDSDKPSEQRAGVQVSLVFANKSADDILLRGELEHLASKHPKRLRIVQVLSRAAAPPKEAAPQQQMQDWHTRAVRITGQLSPRSTAAAAAANKAASKPQRPEEGDKKQQQSSPPSPLPSPRSNVCVESGHVSAFLFRRHLFPPSSNDTLTFVCGPPPMVSATCNHLLALGFQDQSIVEF